MTATASVATTTIQVDIAVRDELRSRGRMGESYNDVIRRLLAVTRSTSSGREVLAERTTAPTTRPWIPQQDRG